MSINLDTAALLVAQQHLLSVLYADLFRRAPDPLKALQSYAEHLRTRTDGAAIPPEDQELWMKVQAYTDQFFVLIGNELLKEKKSQQPQ